MPASISTAKVAATTPTVLLDGGAMEATSAPAGGGARLDFAPSFRAHFIEQLESVRASLEDRKAEVCATIEGVKRELQAKSGYAMTTLPCTVRDTKVKDFNEQNGCNLVELLEAVAISVLAERAGEWKRLSEEIENQCPPTIIRGTGGARSTRSTASSVTTNPAGGAAASLSHLSDHASTFQTPTISRDMRQQGSIWSTNAKKKKYVMMTITDQTTKRSLRLGAPIHRTTFMNSHTPARWFRSLQSDKREDWQRKSQRGRSYRLHEEGRGAQHVRAHIGRLGGQSQHGRKA
jgi:hypothetical protein